MERQSKGSRGLEAYCNGGQGPPRAVAPLKKKAFDTQLLVTFWMHYVLLGDEIAED